jgi:lipopolysaccharide transport system ATP-binding protein
MSSTAIKAEGLSKRYRIGAEQRSQHLREALTGALTRPFKIGRARSDDSDETILWALRDVSFEMSQGEVVGFVGRNGAGKSTLLKILARITEPTEGQAIIHGRVGSLLEVGTGFHNDLTGRENVLLNGAILGMKRAEIRRKFDEIVAFAEVERFIDTPVKYYSSGMYMRLAFAVAAHMDPEILLVDEALAVGDAAFQAKCVAKMEDVALSGRTVVFVTHNMASIRTMCDRVIWLNSGTVEAIGEPDEVISGYLQTSYTTWQDQRWEDREEAPGNDQVRLRSARVRPEDGPPEDRITISTPLEIEIEYWNLEEDAPLGMSIQLVNEHDVVVFDARPVLERDWQGHPFPAGLFRDVCRIPAGLLNDGRHRVEVCFHHYKTHLIHREDDLLIFDVEDDIERRGDWWGKWQGTIRPHFPWRTELLAPDNESAFVAAGGSTLRRSS